MTTYRLVQQIEGQFIVSDFDELSVQAAMAVRGFIQDGVSTNTRLRVELQGQPKFAGLTGPMFGGDGIVRYEDTAANRSLSA